MGPADKRGREASHKHPCPICGKPSWCLLYPDGGVSCYRTDGPGAVELTDGQGNTYWAHPSSESRPALSPLPPARHQRASADKLDRVYGELQHQLTLNPAHEAQLLARGLPEVAIRAHGLRSMHTPAVRATIAQSLADRFVDWEGVPGLYCEQKTGKPRLAVGEGLCIFGRDLTGKIAGVQIRRDNVTGDQSRYHWLSSTKHGGPSPGAPPTYWAPVSRPAVPGAVRITEGAMKALVAAELTGIPGVAAGAGVGSMASDQVLDMLRELRPAKVLVAPDSDSQSKREVSQRVHSCLGKLLWLRQQLGYELQVETWDQSAKGIDDAICAGLPITTVDPEAYRRALPFADAGEPGEASEEASVSHAADWPTPEPFSLRDTDQVAAPMWALPQSYRRMIATVAAAKQITEDTVLASMLGVLSAICAGRYSTRLAPQYSTHSHVWILLALRSSGGKSEALQVFQRDVFRAQKRLQVETQAENDRNASERANLQKQIVAMETGSPEDYPGQLAESRERLRHVAEARPPRFFWKDVSPQKLDVLYARHQRVGIVSAESADWISLIMGRGKDQGPTLGSCLSGYSVEPHGSDRITRDESHSERPVLSLFLACQEADVRAFVIDPVARHRGFMGRTLVVRGHSLVGSRLAYDRRPEIGPTDLLPWSAVVDVVTEQKPPSDADGWLPLDVPASTEARALFSRLFESVERRLGADSPDLQLAELEDIAGRSLEQVGRLALLLHVLWTASRRVPPTSEPISEATVLRAFGLMLWALQSYLDLAAPVATDHTDALELWRALNDSPLLAKGHATTKDWCRLGPARWRSASRIEPLLGILEQLGYITVTTRKNVRGPASKVIELNPIARGRDVETLATVATVCENPLFTEVLRAHEHLRPFVEVCDGMEDEIPSHTGANRREDLGDLITTAQTVFAHNGATVAADPALVEVPEMF